MIGHTISAAGAIELATTVLAIRDQIAPPTINYRVPDPECDLNYVPNGPLSVRIRAAISNSFGFGGHNDCLLVREGLRGAPRRAQRSRSSCRASTRPRAPATSTIAPPRRPTSS